MGREQSDIFDNPKAFRQQVRLAALQVAELGDGELAAALAYELEPFSKIPAADADVAWRENAESNATVKVYDVAVMPRRTAKTKASGIHSAKRLDVIVAAIALLTIAAIATDWLALSSRIENVRRDFAIRAPLDQELRRLDDQERAIRAEANALRMRREAEEAAQHRFAALRSAIPDALGAIASECGGSIVVKEISSPAPFEIALCGVAATAEGAAAIMARLGDAVAPGSWRLEPGAITANDTRTMVDFTCTIRHAEAAKGGE